MRASTTLKAALGARSTPPRWLRRLAAPVGIPLIVLSVFAIYGLVAGRVVLNSSDSLAARGFYVVVWPKPLIYGGIVVADPPARLAHKFEGMVFAKRLGGKAGDIVRHDGTAVCINANCYTQTIKNGAPFGSLLKAGPIPEGFVALFGETPTSLDSRYAEVGLFPVSSIRGVGFSIPFFPDWIDLAAWVTS